MSVETGTRENHTIVDGLTALPDKPAAAPLGASGQWQMLQPAGPRGPQRTTCLRGAPPPAPPEAQENVSASNDLWIGADGPPKRGTPRWGGPMPRLSAAKPGDRSAKGIIRRGQQTSADRSRCGRQHAGGGGSHAPVSLPRARRHADGTEHIPYAHAKGHPAAIHRGGDPNRPAACGAAKGPRPQRTRARVPVRSYIARISAQSRRTGTQSARQGIKEPN